MEEGILSAIGRTPIVKLRRIFPDAKFSLFGKLEGLNPGGSMKDRPAINIIRQALEGGLIGPRTTVVESSSGNMGIGLAQACSYHGLRFICVVDPKATLQNIRLLEAYGAEVDMVSVPDPVTGEFLKARIDRVQSLLFSIEDSFWPNQYSSIHNSGAHHQTMAEIASRFDWDVDYVFCATSTCGTMRGCAEYVRDSRMRTKVIAVDAVGSTIFGGQRARRLIPGHGAAIRPDLYQSGLADGCIHVTDLECVIGCRRLARREAILAGGSSGAVIMAIDSMKDIIPAGATCVAILADRGERYLDTIYSDDWVTGHFGDVSHRWNEFKSEESIETAYV